MAEPTLKFSSNEELVRFVNQCYKESKSAREKLGHFKDWPTWYKYTILSKQQEVTGGVKNDEDITINILDSVVQRIIPILTDRYPTVYCESLIDDPRIEALATNISHHFPYLWERLQFDNVQEDSYTDTVIYGTGMTKVYWDVMALDGRGEIAIDATDPLACFPDPHSTGTDDCMYFIIAQNRTLHHIRKYYPEHGREVEADEMYSDPTEEEEKNRGTKTKFVPDYSKSYVDAMKANTVTKGSALVLEAWIEDLETTDETGALKYPNGRLVTVAGKVLLADRPSPYEYLTTAPVVPCVLRPVPRRFWGKSEIQDLVPLQMELNRRVNQISKNTALLGNPWTIIQTNSGVKPSQITNKPGLVIPVNATNNQSMGIRREAPPALPFYIVDQPRQIKEDIDLLSGVHSVFQGEKPGAIGTGRAIEALQQGVLAKQSKRVRRAEQYIKEICWHCIGLMLQNYTEPRTVVEVVSNDKPRRTTLPALELPEEYKGFPLKSLFQVIVGQGGGFPVSKEEKKDDAMILFEHGVIDELALLDAFDYPKRSEIWGRVKKKKEELEQQALAQMASQGGGPGGNPV